MAKTTNTDILKMTGMRFVRTALALIAGLVIPMLIEMIGNLAIPPQYNAIIVGLLVPALAALDKYAREAKWY